MFADHSKATLDKNRFLQSVQLFMLSVDDHQDTP